MASVNNHETQINDLKNNKHIIAGISHYKSSTEIDANTISDNTIYHVSSSITNAPVTNYGELITLNPGTRHQIYISDASGLYYRKSTEGWRKVWLQNDAITNAVWNDYAERFEKPVDLETEPGDIIALDKSTETEMYKLAEEGDSNIVGVHSDEYGMLIGGVADDEEYNKEHFIPVGMIGRVRTKVIGPIHKGDRIVPSNIPGIGRVFENGDNMFAIVGFATETNLDPNVKKVRTKINTY